MNDPSDPPTAAPGPLATVTSTALLEGLRRTENQTVWGQFVERYRPLIVGYARRLGVTEAEAEDVAQASLLGFSKAYLEGRYDRERGRLRTWLFGIVHKQVLHWQRGADVRARRGNQAVGGEDPLDPTSPPGELERLWDEEWRRAVLATCLAQVQREVEPQTFAVFQRFAVEERPAEEVAEEFQLTPNAVYGAKRRVLSRLRELQPLMEDIW